MSGSGGPTEVKYVNPNGYLSFHNPFASRRLFLRDWKTDNQREVNVPIL
jgi:hypothetical protein